jgi:putative ABC transport system substrate-binding protein
MRRREFIAGLGGAAIPWTLTAQAQQGDRVRRIGILNPRGEGDEDVQSQLAAFRQRLEELGWAAGKNLQIDYRSADGNADRLPRLAAELVDLRPAVVLTNSTPAVAALQRATRTTPIVFMYANNPVGSGFVASLARPGGNITGFVSFEPTMGGKWVELLKEIAPGITRLALLYNPKTNSGQYSQSAEAAARARSLEITPVTFGDAQQLEHAIGDFARALNGGLLVLPDTSTSIHRELIVSLAARHRLPAIFPYRLFFTFGGLIYYGVDPHVQYRLAASYVDRILNGTDPANLPVQAPTKFELCINLKTAKALGLTVSPTLLGSADEVIE